MKNSFYRLVPLLVLLVATGLASAGPTDEPATGKVLVLDNEHTLEGNIERIGTQYRVHRLIGETWVPAERVLRLCPDVPAAYSFLRGRANLNDADERMRLAEWCREHGLRSQALKEVEEAVRLRPQNLASRRLLDHLKQASAPPGTGAKLAATEPEIPVTPVDLTADSMGLFTTKVQPILMNTCAGCHATDHGGKFKLTRSYESEANNHKVVQQNLSAVLAQVNLREPRISPLLTKSVSVHGSLAQAPLKNRQAPAYRTLEEWVRLTLANNPALHESTSSSAPEVRAPAMGKPEATFAADAAPGTDSPATPSTPAASATSKPAMPDPFDPAVFNRQLQPKKPSTTPNKP